MGNTYTDLLKMRMPTLGDIGWDDEINDNVMIAEFVLGSILKANSILDGLAPTDGGGLDVDVAAGNVNVGGTDYAVGAGSKTCTSGVKNWLYVDSSGVLQIATDQPTGDYVAVALVDAGASTLSRIADARNFSGAGGASVSYTPANYTPDTGESGDLDQHLAGIDNRFGALAGMKNKIINGMFDFWQRGTSFTGNEYGADRWKVVANGSTKTFSRQGFTLGQADVPGEPVYFGRVAVVTSAGAANYCMLQQKIEGVRTFAGQEITLTFYAKADAAKNIAVELYQDFGTGGTPSSGVSAIDVNTVALTTSWQKITLSLSVPSIAGKTIGTDGNDYLQLSLWFDAGSDFNSRTNTLGQQDGTFDLARVQLVAGAEDLPFEERPAGMEEILCQRYFCKSYKRDTFAGAATSESRMMIGFTDASNAAASFYHTFEFKVVMRCAPSVTFYAVSGASGKVLMATGDRTPTIQQTSEKHCQFYGSDAASTTRFLAYQYTADAEL